MFFLGHVDPAQARAFLEHEAAVYRQFDELLEQVGATTVWDDSEFDRFARIALENGLRVLAANESWAAWAADQVDVGQ